MVLLTAWCRMAKARIRSEESVLGRSETHFFSVKEKLA